jgi:osmotically-inducible protein OsmY
VEQAVSRIDGVRAVVNELAVMGKTSLTARSNDAILTARVKAAFIDALELNPQTVKVVTERGVVHLMGRVTEREAARAVEAARGVSGVSKVVRVFEIISDADLRELQRAAGDAGAARDAAAKK